MEQENIREIIHALRNPLTAILSNLELLAQGYISELDQETKEIINEIIFNARYMETLMRNSSDVAKIKGIADVIVQKVNLHKIISDILDDMKIIASDIQKHVEFSCPKDISINIEVDMIKRFFIIIFFELLKFINKDRTLKILTSKNKQGINMKISVHKQKKEDPLEVEKIFYELFDSPSKRSAKLHYNYFQKVLTLFKGVYKISKNKDSSDLLITFKNS